MIQDSGDRTEFSTGAVRDLQEEKGRCDLMPLDVIEKYLMQEDSILTDIEMFKKTGLVCYLYEAIRTFSDNEFPNRETASMELSIHFSEGAKKYGENNWQKGLPEWSYISSAVRHYLKYIRGDKDERHDRAFLWNIVCLIWTVENNGGSENVSKD